MATSPLNPITIPPNAPLVPDWAREAVRRLNMLTAATLGTIPQEGGAGAAAFAYSSSNAQLLLPAGFTGRVTLAKITTTGDAGFIDVKNGRVTACNQPT